MVFASRWKLLYSLRVRLLDLNKIGSASMAGFSGEFVSSLYFVKMCSRATLKRFYNKSCQNFQRCSETFAQQILPGLHVVEICTGLTLCGVILVSFASFWCVPCAVWGCLVLYQLSSTNVGRRLPQPNLATGDKP